MSGIAPIKLEFLKSSARVESEDSPVKIEDDHPEIDNEMNDGEDSTEDVASTTEDPSISKKRKNEDKKKYRGQNKKRPRPQRPKDDQRLCPSIMASRECPYGDQCRFIHDLQLFWDSKPADIGDRCPNFETFGKCCFGFSCRFAKAHIDTANWKNLENPEKLEALEIKFGDKNEFNRLEKDVLNKLRRRQYDFKRSLDIVNPKGDSKIKAVNIPQEAAAVETGAPILETVGTADIIGIEKRIPPRLSWAGRLYLAPLTTVGNLPFRRICTELGADITCGEMAMAFELLQGRASEWALVKRHSSERTFGVQVCGNYPDIMTKCAQVLTESLDIDFIDINMGCPIDLVCNKGSGCSLMLRQNKIDQIVRSMRRVMPDEVALTVKMRTGYYENKSTAHLLAPKLADMGVSLFTIHGRSREQRYTKLPDWDYIGQCAKAAAPLPCFGCGDVLSYEDYYQRLDALSAAATTDSDPPNAGIMIARGALIKPWIFTEIKERRHWDISSGERLDILKRYANYGLEHWGSDQQGVNNTRRFLLEWLSFLHRYIPVGILERVPQRINERPALYIGRDDLETLMASSNCADWIKITEMLLGPVQDGFSFLPKHKANSYQ